MDCLDGGNETAVTILVWSLEPEGWLQKGLGRFWRCDKRGELSGKHLYANWVWRGTWAKRDTGALSGPSRFALRHPSSLEPGIAFIRLYLNHDGMRAVFLAHYYCYSSRYLSLIHLGI